LSWILRLMWMTRFRLDIHQKWLPLPRLLKLARLQQQMLQGLSDYDLLTEELLI
jgi:hypothetical protein